MDFVVIAGLTIGLAVMGPAAGAQQVSISYSGTAIEDVDGDGTLDAGEPGLEGCTVALDASPFDGTPDGSDTTDANGDWSIATDVAGPHRIRGTCPGLVQTTADPADLAGDASQANIDLGFFELGQIFGDAFADIDGNGALGPGETFIDGCTVTLDRDADGFIDATTATVDGFFFTNLNGTYRIRATCPDLVQTTADPADIVITSGTDQGGVLFGFSAQAPTTSSSVPTSTGPELPRTGLSGGPGAVRLGLLILGTGGWLLLAAARRRPASHGG